MVVLRNEFGSVLRDARLRQGRTLREVSKDAKVSLGYLSEIERGQKEASSELLSSICAALQLTLSQVLAEVTERVSVAEKMVVPDTIPADFYAGMLAASPNLRNSSRLPTHNRSRVLGNRTQNKMYVPNAPDAFANRQTSRARELAPVG